MFVCSWMHSETRSLMKLMQIGNMEITRFHDTMCYSLLVNQQLFYYTLLNISCYCFFI